MPQTLWNDCQDFDLKIKETPLSSKSMFIYCQHSDVRFCPSQGTRGCVGCESPLKMILLKFQTFQLVFDSFLKSIY